MKKNVQIYKVIALLSFSEWSVRVADHTKCIILNHKPHFAGPTLLNLNSNELHYYPFMISLDRCYWSCKILMAYQVEYIFWMKQKM